MRVVTEINKNISTRFLWALTLLVAVFTYINTSQVAPNDFWWHMAIGRDILNSRTIPTVDIYSHTMFGAPYPSYNMFWLSDVFLFGSFSLGGVELVLFLHSLIIAGTYLVILILCFQNSRKWGVTSFCLLFVIFTGFYAWNVRPQAISFLIGSIFMYSIFTYQKSRNPYWIAVFPVGMLIWVNSHGSFPIGLMLIGIWFLDEIWQVYKSQGRISFKSLLAPGLALIFSTVVCMVNPRGIGIIAYIQTLVSNPAVQSSVPEWAAPSFSSPIGPIFFIGLLLIAVVLAISPRRPTFYQVLMFIAFSILGLSTTRGVIWFGIAVSPVLAYHLSAIIDDRQNQKAPEPRINNSFGVNIGFLVILLAIAILSLPWFREILPMPSERQDFVSINTPIEATNFLMDNSLPEPMFNDMGYGSYLIWAAQPDYKVFVDPRIELYSEGIWTEYHLISNAVPGWDQKLQKYDIRTLVLNTMYQAPLIESLEVSNNWKSIYQDIATHIYVSAD